jgi:hypothetical protein
MQPWNRRELLAGVAAAPVAGLAPEPGPALWEVRQRGARVFLFGDNPAQRAPWHSSRIEAVVKASQVFWRETPVGGPPALPLFLAKGVDPARPLASWLTDQQRARVAAATTAAGLPAGSVDKCRPWLAAVFLEDRFNAHAGFKPEYAPASTLTAVAQAAGKPIRCEFPDMAAIVDYFASFSPAAEVGSLMRTLSDIEAGPAAADRDAQAWSAGDVSAAVSAVLRLRRAFPDYYERILAERNRRWRGRILDMLAGGGVTFVLVGDDHLAGPDSVQSQLARIGLAARRV